MSRYALFPTEYPLELCKDKKRDKARAFLEYCLDLDSSIENSGSFYAQAWKINKRTANRWIEDFRIAIEKHHLYWLEKNTENAHRIYKKTKKSVSHLCPTDVPLDRLESTENTGYNEKQCPTDVPPMPLSINNKQYTSSSEPQKTHVTDGLFNARFAELRLSTNKFLGSKEKSYEAYLRVADMFDIKVLAHCYKQYFKSFKDTDQEQTVGLAKFIDNDMHLSYLPKRLKLITGGVELVGELKDEVFACDDGKLYELNTQRFLEKLEAKEIIFEGVA